MTFCINKWNNFRLTTQYIHAGSVQEALKSIPRGKDEAVSWMGVFEYACIPNICWWSETIARTQHSRNQVIVDFS